jgi:hypothetical protein
MSAHVVLAIRATASIFANGRHNTITCVDYRDWKANFHKGL